MSVNDVELCGCGKPLHYQDQQKRLYVEQMIAQNGPDVVITACGNSWYVSRHFIALHGIVAAELPELAKKYGFKEAKKS